MEAKAECDTNRRRQCNRDQGKRRPARVLQNYRPLRVTNTRSRLCPWGVTSEAARCRGTAKLPKGRPQQALRWKPSTQACYNLFLECPVFNKRKKRESMAHIQGKNQATETAFERAQMSDLTKTSKQLQ